MGRDPGEAAHPGSEGGAVVAVEAAEKGMFIGNVHIYVLCLFIYIR